MNERRMARLAVAGLLFASAASLTCGIGAAQATSSYSEPVTSHASAAAQSREEAGRVDPMSMSSAPLHHAAHHTASHHGSHSKTMLVPPPPVTVPMTFHDDPFIAAPEKPHIADRLRVISIMDDRAIVSLPSDLCRKNGWADRITVGEGQEFNAVKVLHIDRDTVTVEEDGVRTVCRMGSVK